MTFEVRTYGDPWRFVDAIRNAVASADKDLPLIDVRTQEQQVAAAIGPERSFAIVTAGFGIIALALASIGVYGIVASGVSRRTNEIGIRMALGARKQQVVRMVLAEAVGLTLVGICAGMLVALFLTRFLSSYLFGLKPNDSLTLVGTALLLLLVAMVASWAPARRAASIEPVLALRHD
jgi:ABC-type antimicrobial peptide transport system permease subunit